jgi:hypothetical protein
MVIKIKLKNVDKYVLLDHEVFEALNNLSMFKEYKVFDNLRQHSSGVPVFQKYLDTVKGKLKVESVYLALFIAKKYIAQPPADKRLFLSFLNGDKLDLRLKNLKWEPMSMLSRIRVSQNNKTGFRGVRHTPQGKFVAMVSDGVKQVYLGTFESAEEAALAYNKKSLEMFGITANLNQVNDEGQPVPYYVPDEVKTRVRRKRTNKTAVAKPIEVEKIGLFPVHFSPLRKRGRKKKEEDDFRPYEADQSIAETVADPNHISENGTHVEELQEEHAQIADSTHPTEEQSPLAEPTPPITEHLISASHQNQAE